MLSYLKRTIIFGALLLIAVAANAQTDNLSAAVKFLQDGKLDSARTDIEKVIADTAFAKNAQAWYVRGFIYKEIYKKSQASDPQSPARKVALNSFVNSLQLDTSKENRQRNLSNIKFLAARYYNDAASAMDTVNYSLAIKDYNEYRKIAKIIDPNTNLKKPDVEFNLAIGSVYTKLFQVDMKARKQFLDSAKKAYDKVLSLDTDNISANYNMGILYYNQAVTLVNQMDYDTDIMMLQKIQNNSVLLFKESLPFMEKAYELDPGRKSTLEGLSGIYYSLNDYKKSDEFKAKLKAVEKKKTQQNNNTNNSNNNK